MKIPCSIAVAIVLSTAILSMIPPCPSLSGARSPYLSLDDILFMSPEGPEGQVPVGNNTLVLALSHDLGEEFIDWAPVNVTITHWFGGDLYTFYQEDIVIFIGEDQVRGEIRVGDVYLEQGDFNLSVSMNVSGQFLDRWERIRVEDIADIGIGAAGLDDLEFQAGKGYRLPYEVTYQGNVEDLAMEIVLYISIWLVHSDQLHGPDQVTLNKTLHGPDRPPIDPGFVFESKMDDRWTPKYGGTYAIEYIVEDDCLQDQFGDPYLPDSYKVEVKVHPAPVVQGWVTAGVGRYPENITVTLSTYGDPLSGPSWVNSTDDRGYFAFYDVPVPKRYTLIVWSLWSTNFTADVDTGIGITVTVNCSIHLVDFGGVRGIVDLPVEGSAADVVVEMMKGEEVVQTVETTYGGMYEVTVLPSGLYDVRFSRVGFHDVSVTSFIVEANLWNHLDVNMTLSEFDLTILPRDGAVNFDVEGSVQLTFSRPLDTRTVNVSTIRLQEAMSGETVDAIYHVPDPANVVEVEPRSMMDPGTEYRIQVMGAANGSCVTDAWGEPFPDFVTSSFLTIYEFRVLRVIDSYPVWSPGGIPVDTVFRLYLSEAVDPATADNGTFMLLDESDVPVDGTIYYDESEVMLTFTPSSPLGYDTEYELVLTENVKALMPGAKFEGYSRTFRTEDPPPTTGSIKGQILERGFYNIDSYRITVEVTRGVELIRGDVNENGLFVIMNVPAGTWWLRVTARGYSTYLIEVQVTPGGETDVGTVFLDRTSDADPPEEVEPETDGSMVTICVLMTLITLVGFSLMLIMLQKKKTAKPGTGPPAPAKTQSPTGSSPIRGFEVPMDRIVGEIEKVFETPSSASEAPSLEDADGPVDNISGEDIEPAPDEEPILDEDLPLPEIDGEVPRPRLLEPPPPS